MTHQALSGIRILDFSQVLAGPFATQQLAQLGADVIKIEQPGVGDITRGLMSSADNGMAPSFITCNIGKRSLALDLKHAQAKDIIFKLVATCDAVVENFKPGTIDRLGFGYEAIKAVKPNIVYASISGYGQSGPKSELPAFDGAIQASSGMMSLSGFPESGPVRAGYFAVDMSTALNAAFSITAAILRRERTGDGQRVDVAMLDTALMMQAPQVSAYLMNGTLPDLIGNRSPTKQPTANVFPTADGYVQVAALKETQIQNLLGVLDRADLYEGYENPRARIKATAEWDAALNAAFKTQTTQHWIDRLSDAGVPTARIRDLAEVAEDEQLAHRLSIGATTIANGADPEGADSDGADTVQVASASHVAHPAPPAVQRPAPLLGQHTREILAEIGYTNAAIAALVEDAAVAG